MWILVYVSTLAVFQNLGPNWLLPLTGYDPRRIFAEAQVQRSIENSTVLPSSYSATNATRLLVIGSRGLACVDERARHFLLDPLHRASADTKLGGNL
jgi:hypothetical protein